MKKNFSLPPTLYSFSIVHSMEQKCKKQKKHKMVVKVTIICIFAVRYKFKFLQLWYTNL